MSYQLSSYVAAYVQQHGAGMTAAEIAVLYAVAERASHTGQHAREAWDSEDWKLAKAAGVTSDVGLRNVLQRLRGRGLELRVQRGTDSRGRPQFAHRGAQVTYRLPNLNADATASPSLNADVTASPSDATASPSDATASPSPVLTSPYQKTPLPPAVDPDRSAGIQVTEGGGDFQTEQDQATVDEEAAWGVLRAVLTGFRGKISPRDEAKLLRLVVAAFSKLSPLELKHHLLDAGDLNARRSPVGILISRLTNLPSEPLQGLMKGASRHVSVTPVVEDERTDAEREAAAEQAAAARAEIRETLRAAAEKAARDRRATRHG
jgi:hypothetical protein